MNRLVRTFLESLHDRIIAAVGSMIGSTFSAFRAAHHAEQQSFLEELARKYEAEGKPRLADQLRNQANLLELDDPGREARVVFRNLLDDRELPALPDAGSPEKNDSDADCSPPKKKRRGRKPSGPVDDMGISLD